MAQRPHGLPSRQQILDFIASSATPAGKREIARAFGLHGQEKITLKALLKDMADEGLIDSAPGRAFHKMGGIPKVTVLRVVEIEGATVIAVPESWHGDAAPPKLRVIDRGRRGTAFGIGDRMLARTEEAGNGWVAHPMKRLARGEELVLGVLRLEGDRLWLKPVEKNERRELLVSDAGDAGPGDLVMAEKTGRPPRITARVTEKLGKPFEAKSFSLIAIHKHNIPDRFPEEVIAEAERMAKEPLGEGREDLRHLPIVAIDPVDARDHDDAVWAAADEDPGNAGGFKAIVAIADVAYYVRPDSALDKQARKRGNSVYFPDRVVPMLPETLSADICSLKESKDRAALACHLTIAKNGALKAWKFTRAVIRVAANIAYEDAQALVDGERVSTSLDTNGGESRSSRAKSRDVAPDLLETALKPLWACWAVLAKARAAREPLDLDLPERRVVLDEKGRILSVAPRERLDSMRLIEDYMIAANVAAAKALEAKKAQVMYRVHEPPSREKLVALKEYLATFDIAFALGQVVKPATFNRILAKLDDHDSRPQIMEQVLRTQTQAYYAPANHGHFGLSLGSYAHFTSPIRRYSDLLVHRALVGAYDLAPAVQQTRLAPADAADLSMVGELISAAERRAMAAERETIDRYVAAFLSEKVGEVLETRITGVRAFGFFATVEGLGGDGLVPASTLGDEYFRYDEASQSLIGEQSGERFFPGQRLPLRLVEADPIGGALRFALPDGAERAPMRPSRGGPRKDRRPTGRRGRPANIRHR
ncbi:ribonuclease R [Sphingomonas vulcanisoli]|uniref:Ribonuclease R n=1 Tax=Sphingomonas vulcanisoli TaxID=1658060 RepID=A0ABX0TRX9_9SPHN|nr:VacB/RNase II family 3'-5' exoribonuclease [Sphingomonas vulcanisoli]NIJ08278.1 ribonuclease R [Sphingomonas vulcanisoli]